MTTYRLQYKLQDGRKVLDPTVFRTRSAAKMRIALFTNKKGVVIKAVRIPEPKFDRINHGPFEHPVSE